MLCGIFSLASGFVNKRLFKQRRFKMERQGHKAFVWNGLVVLLTLNLIIAGGCELILYLVSSAIQIEDIWGTSFLYGLIASLVTLVRLSVHFSDMMIIKGKENLVLQKKYLKLQLNPHFVFNSLSSLAGMIQEDPRMAEEYVVKWSQIYRHILHHIDKDYITIAEGTELIKVYVDLLNMRYNDNIVLKTDGFRGYNDECILSLSLQLVIENVVKHNSPQGNKKLQIEISRHGNIFVIKNNLIYMNNNNDRRIESFGIGISNLKQRYKLECKEEPEFVVTRHSFEVKLPIIKKSVNER